MAEILRERNLLRKEQNWIQIETRKKEGYNMKKKYIKTG